MQKRHVAIIGGGIAGLEAAAILAASGYEVTVFESADKMGGHVAKWDLLFPNMRKGEEIMTALLAKLPGTVQLCTDTTIVDIERVNDYYVVHSNHEEKYKADVVLITGGFDTFDAKRKEEYGYGIYDNVITSVELEEKLQDDPNAVWWYRRLVAAWQLEADVTRSKLPVSTPDEPPWEEAT